MGRNDFLKKFQDITNYDFSNISDEDLLLILFSNKENTRIIELFIDDHDSINMILEKFTNKNLQKDVIEKLLNISVETMNSNLAKFIIDIIEKNILSLSIFEISKTISPLAILSQRFSLEITDRDKIHFTNQLERFLELIPRDHNDCFVGANLFKALANSFRYDLLDVRRKLLSKYPEILYHFDENNSNIYHYVAQSSFISALNLTVMLMSSVTPAYTRQDVTSMINKPNIKGETPLILAIKSLNFANASLMLKYINKDEHDLNKLALFHLVDNLQSDVPLSGVKEIMKDLLDSRVISLSTKKQGMLDIVSYMISKNKLSYMKYLRDLGFDFFNKDALGRNYLMIAAIFNNVRAIYKLLDMGLESTDIDSNGSSLLFYIAQYINESGVLFVRLYEKYPKALNIRNSDGLTPLMIACKAGNVNLLSLLIEDKITGAKKFNTDFSLKDADNNSLVMQMIMYYVDNHLLEKVINFNLANILKDKNSLGFNALEIAVQFDHKTGFLLLLDLFLSSKLGLSNLMICCLKSKNTYYFNKLIKLENNKIFFANRLLEGGVQELVRQIIELKALNILQDIFHSNKDEQFVHVVKDFILENSLFCLKTAVNSDSVKIFSKLVDFYELDPNHWREAMSNILILQLNSNKSCISIDILSKFLLIDSEYCFMNFIVDDNQQTGLRMVIEYLSKITNPRGDFAKVVKLIMNYKNFISYENLNLSLIDAINYGLREVVEALIEMGANLNFQDENGKTIIMHMILKADVFSDFLSDILAKRNFNQEAIDYSGKSYLDYAILANNIDIFKKLLSFGFKPRLSGNNLLESAKDASLEIFRLCYDLLSKEKNFDIIIFSCMTNLIKRQDLEKIDFVLQQNSVNIYLIGQDGFNLISHAIIQKDIDCIKIILKYMNRIDRDLVGIINKTQNSDIVNLFVEKFPECFVENLIFGDFYYRSLSSSFDQELVDQEVSSFSEDIMGDLDESGQE